MPKLGSLFSGCGGLDLAFINHGFELTFMAEVDRHACAVLRRHHPDVPNVGDVKLVRAEQKDSGYNIVAPKYIIALGLLGELPTPLAFVDPLGHWHEHDDELDEESWRAEWRAALTQVCNGIAGFRVVVVDMHI